MAICLRVVIVFPRSKRTKYTTFGTRSVNLVLGLSPCCHHSGCMSVCLSLRISSFGSDRMAPFPIYFRWMGGGDYFQNQKIVGKQSCSLLLEWGELNQEFLSRVRSSWGRIWVSFHLWGMEWENLRGTKQNGKPGCVEGNRNILSQIFLTFPPSTSFQAVEPAWENLGKAQAATALFCQALVRLVRVNLISKGSSSFICYLLKWFISQQKKRTGWDKRTVHWFVYTCSQRVRSPSVAHRTCTIIAQERPSLACKCWHTKCIIVVLRNCIGKTSEMVWSHVWKLKPHIICKTKFEKTPSFAVDDKASQERQSHRSEPEGFIQAWKRHKGFPFAHLVLRFVPWTNRTAWWGRHGEKNQWQHIGLQLVAEQWKAHCIHRSTHFFNCKLARSVLESVMQLICIWSRQTVYSSPTSPRRGIFVGWEGHHCVACSGKWSLDHWRRQRLVLQFQILALGTEFSCGVLPSANWNS